MGKKESARGKLYVNFQNKEWGWTTRCYIITIRKRNKKKNIFSDQIFQTRIIHPHHKFYHFDFYPNSLQGLHLARHLVFVGSRSMININTIVIIMAIIIKIIIHP